MSFLKAWHKLDTEEVLFPFSLLVINIHVHIFFSWLKLFSGLKCICSLVYAGQCVHTVLRVGEEQLLFNEIIEIIIQYEYCLMSIIQMRALSSVSSKMPSGSGVPISLVIYVLMFTGYCFFFR